MYWQWLDESHSHLIQAEWLLSAGSEAKFPSITAQTASFGFRRPEHETLILNQQYNQGHKNMPTK